MIETLHTYQPSESDLHKGWRLGVAATWQHLHRLDLVQFRRALQEIEGFGNAGPPVDLKVRSGT